MLRWRLRSGWLPCLSPNSTGHRWSGRGLEQELENGGQTVPGPGRLHRVQEGIRSPWSGLDPARRPKDWTTVAVLRRLESANQRESGRLFYVEGNERGRPSGPPNGLDGGGRARPCFLSWQTTGQRVPGRLLQVRVPPEFKLDPARRPRNWTAVAVPRRLVTSDQ